MSFSDRLHNAAVRGCLIAALCAPVSHAVFAQPVSDDAGGQARAGKAQDQPQPDKTPLVLEAIQNELKGITRAIEAQKDEADAKKKDEREKSDLLAQWEMAHWAKNAVYVAIGALVLTFIGILLIWRTLIHTRDAAIAARDMVTEGKNATTAAIEATKEAKRQADLAEDSFRRLERPYLLIKITETSPLRNQGAVQPYFNYRLVNYGKLPAILRSVSIGLQDRPEFPLQMPEATPDTRYEVIAAGSELINHRQAIVTNSTVGQRFRGDSAEGLILHGIIKYEDSTGAVHTDSVCMRGMKGGTDFTIEGGEEYNWHKTEYPKPKPA